MNKDIIITDEDIDIIENKLLKRKGKFDLERRNAIKYTDNVDIYEVGVRDFSIDEYGQITYKGKFLGFCEEGTVTKNGFSSGMDYLDMLGAYWMYMNKHMDQLFLLIPHSFQ